MRDIRPRAVAVNGGFFVEESFHDGAVGDDNSVGGAELEGKDATILRSPFGKSVFGLVRNSCD